MAVPKRFTNFSKGEWKVVEDKVVVPIDGMPTIGPDSHTATILRFSSMFDADQDAEDGFINDLTGEYSANRILVGNAPKMFAVLEQVEEILYMAQPSESERMYAARACTQLLDAIAGEQLTGLRKYLSIRRKMLNKDELAVDDGTPKAASPQVEFNFLTAHGTTRYQAVQFTGALTYAPEFWPDWLVKAILRNPREANAIYTDGERWYLNHGNNHTCAILNGEWITQDARGNLEVKDAETVSKYFISV